MKSLTFRKPKPSQHSGSICPWTNTDSVKKEYSTRKINSSSRKLDENLNGLGNYRGYAVENPTELSMHDGTSEWTMP